MLLVAILPLTVKLSYAGTPAGSITYSAATDTITVTGANSTHPAEFLDLYNADVAGGWGQVTKLGNNQFLFDCRIVIGDWYVSTTYFNDTDKEIVFSDSSLSGVGQNLINVLGGGFLTLGVVVNETLRSTRQGCTIYDLETVGYHQVIRRADDGVYSGLYLYSYNQQAGATTSSIYYPTRIWNSRVGRQANIAVNSDSNVYNVITDAGFNYWDVENNGVISNCYIVSSLYYCRVSGGTTTFRDLIGVGGGKAFWVNSAGSTAYAVDCDFDTWEIDWSTSGTINRQYSFALYVLNGALTDFVEDANVTLIHDGVVFGSWLSNSTGQISTQTLTYGFYNQTGGDSMYGGTAWTLTITHPDWATYTSVFYPYSKIEWSISMQDTSIADNNMITIGLLLGGVAFLGIIVIRRKQ